MYGSENTDPLVKYYDASLALGSEDEVAWYLNTARAFGGPVLDLACGTGRLALRLAREGFDVTGLDQSEGMLHQFQKKRAQQPPQVRQRVHMAHQKMSDFSLDKTFNTILCCDAFFHNVTVEQEINCLRCVAEHLTPEGRFVFNLPNPTCAFIMGSVQSKGQDFAERGRYPLDDGGLVVIEHAQDGNVLDQTITTTMRFTRFDAAGNETERSDSWWKSRYLFRYEAIHLLHRCGFDVEALAGDYTDGPVTERGQLIFQVKLCTIS